MFAACAVADGFREQGISHIKVKVLGCVTCDVSSRRKSVPLLHLVHRNAILVDEVTSKSRFIHRNATFVDGNCSLAATKLGCYPKHCGGLSREWSSPFLVFLTQKDPLLFPKLLLQAVSDTKRPLSVPENGSRSQTGTIMASSVPESDFPINKVWRETPHRPQTHIFTPEPKRDKRNNDREMRKYSQNPVIMKAVKDAEEIRLTINEKLDNDVVLSKDDVREIINAIVYRQQREDEAAEAEEAARLEAEANRMTLRKFIDQYLVEIANGARQTDKGMNFSPNTVKAVKQGLTQFKNFCDYKKHDYDFDEIDLQFYHDFTAYLKAELKNKKGEVLKKAYNVNSIGKCIMQLKVVMNVAGSEGFHNNNLWKDKKFKSTRIDVDNVYLTREDLAAIMKADLSELEPAAVIARDIFLVGCWTAQRVSDYGNLTKDQFDTLTKRWIEDVPDPENPGKTKAEIRTREITYVKIRQQKTGAKVSIPISSECKAILEKYDFNLPKMPDAELNRLLKKICREAGLNEIVEIVETNGGTPTRVTKKKWELVHTHTARRTGATLMYLSGMDVYDIMKVTGHSSPIMLKKYIKADQLEVIEKITDKYDYFD